MAEITVVETPPIETAPTVAEVLAVEQTEAVVEAAVEIAEIEAARDVELAEIQAETTQAVLAADEAMTTERDVEWRQNIEARLNSQDQTQQTILSTLQTLTERLPPNQPLEPESPEVTPESQEAPEPKPKPKAHHHRLI